MGAGGGTYNQKIYFFGLQVDGPISAGGGGGAYKLQFTV